jgi:hypothetical protein
VNAEEYLREVEFALRDLPWRQRRDLVAELGAHLAELPPDADLRPRLGWPAQYAADLRAAAGLERQHGIRAYLRARRPRNVTITAITLALVLTAIGLGIAAVVWVDGYQPLGPAGADYTPGPSTPTPGQDGVTVFYHAGRPFGYGVLIRNYGRYTVRVLGTTPKSDTPFDGPRSIFNPFTGHLFMSTSQSPINAPPLERFHPFELKPRSYRWLVFKGVYRCGLSKYPRNESFGLADFPVRYSFLWRTVTVPIKLDEPVTVSFRKEACD